MRRFSNIDNVFLIKHGLTLQEIYVLEWMLHLPIWADKIILGDTTLYFASKTKACQDLPMITKQRDTMQRYYRRIENKQLIKLHKVSNKDYVQLLPNCGEWNSVITTTSTDKPDDFDGKETTDRPTYSNTIPNSIGNSKSVKQPNQEETDLFGTKPDPKKKTLFKNSAYFEMTIFKLKLKELEALNVDLEYYHRAINNWSESKSVKRTGDGWIATCRTWAEKDKDKGQLRFINQGTSNSSSEMTEYLNM